MYKLFTNAKYSVPRLFRIGNRLLYKINIFNVSDRKYHEDKSIFYGLKYTFDFECDYNDDPDPVFLRLLNKLFVYNFKERQLYLNSCNYNCDEPDMLFEIDMDDIIENDVLRQSIITYYQLLDE